MTGIVRAAIGADGGGTERLGGDRPAPGQHDVGDVEGAEHGRQRHAEVLAGAVEHGGAVAGVGLEPPGEQRLRHLGLQAAPLAACAQRRRRGRRRRGRSRRRRTTSR